MNNNITETEQLLNNIGMSITEVCDIIKKGVGSRFKSMTQLWGYDTVDDLSQTVLLYFLSPMKSTGEIRLNYYIKKYDDKKHIENLIRTSAYQAPICQARRKEVRNKPISYDVEFNQEGDDCPLSLEKTFADDYVAIKFEDNLNFEDLIDNLTEILNQINLDNLKKQSKKDNLAFLIDMNNYLFVYKQTKTQLNLLKDLFYGYRRGELREKYSNYGKHLNVLKLALSIIYPQYKDEVKNLV